MDKEAGVSAGTNGLPSAPCPGRSEAAVWTLHLPAVLKGSVSVLDVGVVISRRPSLMN